MMNNNFTRFVDNLRTTNANKSGDNYRVRTQQNTLPVSTSELGESVTPDLSIRGTDTENTGEQQNTIGLLALGTLLGMIGGGQLAGPAISETSTARSLSKLYKNLGIAKSASDISEMAEGMSKALNSSALKNALFDTTSNGIVGGIIASLMNDTNKMGERVADMNNGEETEDDTEEKEILPQNTVTFRNNFRTIANPYYKF